jgi:predicted amidohydrolase
MSRNCQVSDDPADAFLKIFDDLPQGLFLGDEAHRLSTDDAVIDEANAVERQVLRDGRAAPGLCDLPDNETRNRAGFARLIGLDRVLRHVHPHAGAPPPKCLWEISTRYARLGHFNTDANDGLLLPRLMEYGAPPHRRDKYESFGVVRVQSHQLHNVTFKAIGIPGCTTHTGKDDLVVACLPFLDVIDDVTLGRVIKYGQARYRLGPCDDPRLQHRIDDAITALDRSGATVGLLPEGALSEPLLSLWQQRLAATNPATSQLSLIVIGTGPVTDQEPPPNRAVVLDRAGALLWTQDKLCDFTLVDSTITDWRLPGLGTDNHLEDITLGDKWFVAETKLGRLAILICEDLQRCETRDVVPRDFGLSHAFVPVFDAPLGTHRWQRFASERHLHWTGTRVVVANSRVVGNLQGRGPDIPTGFGLSPTRKPGTWEYDVTGPETTTSATDAVTVRLLALGPPPAALRIF